MGFVVCDLRDTALNMAEHLLALYFTHLNSKYLIKAITSILLKVTWFFYELMMMYIVLTITKKN